MRAHLICLMGIALVMGTTACTETRREPRAVRTTEIVVTRPPPPLRNEEIPPPPSGGPAEVYVWQRGHWHWDGHEYVWKPGHHERRPATTATWVPPEWVAHEGRWVFKAGHWVYR